MKSFSILPLVCGAALVTACSATPPPKELVDARAEMAQARAGAAKQVAPAQLHVAEEELNLAEQECASDCGSDKTKDRSYIALRKVQLAEAEARLTVATNEASQASQQVQLTQAQMNANTRTELSQTKQQLAATQLAAQQAQMQAQQAMADLARIAATKEDERGLIITLNGSVLFATNKDVLLGAGDTKLDGVAEALKGKLRGRTIEVQGYTDSQGAADYNIGLSQRRADSVRAYLVSKGVPAEKITARGYGKDRPVADNATAEGRADNRRVEIVVKPADPAMAN